MLTFYPEIKQFHVCCVMLSGALFALRGAAHLAGARWPRALVLRWLSAGIDTALLTAALMLLTILPGGAFANGWLAVKLVLVAAYIGLGIAAMHAAQPRRRALFYIAALLCFVAAWSIARTHHPLGAFA